MQRRSAKPRTLETSLDQELVQHSIHLAGQTFTLSQADVLAVVRRALAGGLPPAAKRFTRWYLLVDGERLSVKWVMSLATDLPTDRFTTYQARSQLRKLGLEARSGDAPVVKGKDLNQPKAILAQTIRNIRAYLNGDRAFSPSDEKLCDWVQFCYTFELFAEGAALFKLVRPDAVHPWLYERTRRLARACELRNVAGQSAG